MLGAVTGVMGTLQATETLKEILGIGETLSGRLLVWDALATRFRTVKLRPDPKCKACGPEATLTRPVRAHRHLRPRLCHLNRWACCCCPAAMTASIMRSCLPPGAAALGRSVVLFATNRGCLGLARDWSGLD